MSKPVDPLAETVYWIFVDLGDKDKSPRYWIAPNWWLLNNIYEVHKQYLDRSGGRRPINPDSTHHAIDEERLKQWKDKWDILGICE